MRFELTRHVARPPAAVFAFLRDKHQHAQEARSPVLALEKTTSGPVGVGTGFREVVRVLPCLRCTIRSVVTRCDADRVLEERYAGCGMRGHLAYRFAPEGGGTRLTQRQTLFLAWWLRPLEPLVRRAFGRRLAWRLDGIAARLGAPVAAED